MLTSVTALVLTAASFIAYDLVTFRQSLARNLTATSTIVAENSTSALLFDDEELATRNLSEFKVDPHVRIAALYNQQGNLYARYPTNAPDSEFPRSPGRDGAFFENGRLIVVHRAFEDDKFAGTVYVESTLGAVYERLRLYAGLAALIIFGSALVALGISSALQRRVTDPILALVESARRVSERADLSVRAPRTSPDELGLLTDAFNVMLGRIQEHTEERKRVEESLALLAAIVQSSDDAIIGKDLQSRVVSWNFGAERMFGYMAAEMIGQPITRLVSPDRPDEEAGIIEEVKRGEIRRFETIRMHKDGRPIHISLSISPIKNAKGEIVGVSSIAHDITERKHAEEQVRQMNVELEQRVEARTSELTAANHEMEAFTYSVAHDLRAPLRHIDAFSRILSEDFVSALPPEARRYLEHIRTGSRNMSQLVDDLLNLARVGRQELRRKSTPLSPLVNEVVADLRREAGGRDIEWHIRELPTVECDSGLMKQVFANLLSNAVKYTRPRQKAVIEVGSVKANGGNAIFVRDNGVGFNMKYVDKLFGVFQRLHRAEEFEGTGVGLATVDRIVRKHGGSIWAEASINQGATFYFTVPGLGKSHHSE